jgi:hypothetical protein
MATEKRLVEVTARLSREDYPDVPCKVRAVENTNCSAVAYSRPEILEPRDLPDGRYDLRMSNGQVIPFYRSNGQWRILG